MILTDDKNFYRRLVRLAPPIALQSLAAFSLGLTDNVMLASLGDGAVAGVYMANQLQSFLQMMSVGIEGALVALGAQLFGRGDIGGIKKTALLGMLSALLFSAVLTAPCVAIPRRVLSLFTFDDAAVAAGEGYLRLIALSFVPFALSQAFGAVLRAIERPQVGLFASVLAFAVNALGDYALIFGKMGLPALGIRGAAIATIAARLVELCAVSLCALFIWRRTGKGVTSSASPRGLSVAKSFFKLGLPVVGGQLVWSFNSFFATTLMGHLPCAGTVAAMSIAGGLYNLSYVVSGGLAGAVGIIFGEAVGSGERSRLYKYSRSVQIIFLALGVLTGAAMQAAKNPFIGLYGAEGDAARLAAEFIDLLSVFVVGTCYQSACLFGLVKSGGDTPFVFKTDAFFVFCIIVPVSLLLSSFSVPPVLVFAALKCDQLLKCPVAALKLRRLDWVKNYAKEQGG